MTWADMATDTDDDTFRRSVSDRERRKLRARKRPRRSILEWLGVFGIVGWSVAAPALAGALVGGYLDERWPGRVAWRVTLLFAGLTFGCVAAWHWVRQESRRE